MELLNSFSFFVGLLIGLFISFCWFYWKRRRNHSCDRASDTDFKTPLRNFILNEVKKINSLHLYFLREEHEVLCSKRCDGSAYILSFSIARGIVSRDEILFYLDADIRKKGRLCFDQHVTVRGVYPDHTFWPVAFAYALEVGEFSDEEIRKIRFDHEQTVGTFIKQCGERDLLEKLFLKLFRTGLNLNL